MGEIITSHGRIKTPAFIPVATLGVIKGGLSPEEAMRAGIQCQITNAFHFLDLDRVEQVKEMGGLHKFFNFDKPIFTDSGGFQIFSLGKGSELGLGKIGSIFPGEGEEQRKKGQGLVKITQKGVRFRSPRDGRQIYLIPELSFEIQRKLGADFIYLLDVCGSPTDRHKEAQKEMEISHQWFERFLDAARRESAASGNIARVGRIAEPSQEIFGIIQGGLYRDLRKQSTKFVNNLPVFGIAIGGALGKNKKEMYKTISWVNEVIDWQRPHHLLGIGDLEVLEEIVKLGIDLFDCALPTRIARHGTAMTGKGYLNLASGRYKNALEPIDKSCRCPTCKKWTRAQLNFLFRAKEQLAGKLLTIHNLYFLENKLKEIRKKIEKSEI